MREHDYLTTRLEAIQAQQATEQCEYSIEHEHRELNLLDRSTGAYGSMESSIASGHWDRATAERFEELAFGGSLEALTVTVTLDELHDNLTTMGAVIKNAFKGVIHQIGQYYDKQSQEAAKLRDHAEFLKKCVQEAKEQSMPAQSAMFNLVHPSVLIYHGAITPETIEDGSVRINNQAGGVSDALWTFWYDYYQQLQHLYYDEKTTPKQIRQWIRQRQEALNETLQDYDSVDLPGQRTIALSKRKPENVRFLRGPVLRKAKTERIPNKELQLPDLEKLEYWLDMTIERLRGLERRVEVGRGFETIRGQMNESIRAFLQRQKESDWKWSPGDLAFALRIVAQNPTESMQKIDRFRLMYQRATVYSLENAVAQYHPFREQAKEST